MCGYRVSRRNVFVHGRTQTTIERDIRIRVITYARRKSSNLGYIPQSGSWEVHCSRYTLNVWHPSCDLHGSTTRKPTYVLIVRA